LLLYKPVPCGIYLKAFRTFSYVLSLLPSSTNITCRLG
jgi:hypothetical protein